MSNDELWPDDWDADPDGPPPEPLPLDLGAIATPGPFPTDSLPPAFRRMVKAVAANKQVPEELPALFGLGALSTLAGPRIAISRGHGWTEPTNGYYVVVMESGGGKSPAAKDVIRPLTALQKRIKVDHAALVNSKLDELDAKRGSILRDPATANRIEAEIAEAKASLKRPPRLLMGSDTTPESLAEAMSRNGGHTSILDAEGDFFGHLSGRYNNKVPNLGLALKSYDGDSYEVGRIGRDQDDIERGILTFAFGVQPSVMEDTAKDRQMVERGLLARFIVAQPASKVGTREPDGAAYDVAALEAWADVLMHIYEIPMPPQDTYPFPALHLHPSARKRHVDFCQWIERRMHPDDGDLSGITGWASKHKGRALRIAALLHLANGHPPDEPVTERAMNAAIEICQWAIGHAVAILGMSALGAVDDDTQCAEVLDWLRRTQPKRFGPRDARRGVRRKWVTVTAMAAALDRLVALGYLAVERTRDRAGRDCSLFVPHPSLLQVDELGRAA